MPRSLRPSRLTGPRSCGSRQVAKDGALVAATAWRFRTGVPWRDVPERFGTCNRIYRNFNRWAKQGVWERVLRQVQAMADVAG